jgi:cytochrome bd-type quinol oxidase subunit 2
MPSDVAQPVPDRPEERTIMADTTPTLSRWAAPTPALQAGAGLMTLAAAGFVAYGVIFFVRNFTDSFLELGIGPGEVDVGRQQIEAFSPSLAHYISHLHLAVAGFLAATGLAVGFLAWFGVRQGSLWAFIGAVAAPVLALAVALPAHYPYNLDTLGHLGPIYLATVIFSTGALTALAGLLGLRPAAERGGGAAAGT